MSWGGVNRLFPLKYAPDNNIKTLECIIDTNFQYIKIDAASLAKLKQQNLHGPLSDKVELDKWCIDTTLSIALLYLGHVGRGIARMDDGSEFWYFLLMINGNQIEIELIGQSLSIAGARFSPAFAERYGFTPDQLSYVVNEAIKVWGNGRDEDFREQSRQRKLEQLRQTPIRIMHGKFSDLLRQCIDSVVEVRDMEKKFRSICLRHFKEHNVKVQKYHSFYLHDDEDSLFVFDAILWMYMHIRNATIDGFVGNYELIANVSYRADDDGFFLGGSKNFLSEKYFPQRLQQGALILYEGQLQFSYWYLKKFIHELDNVVEPT